MDIVGGVLPTTQFAYRRGLCTCDAVLCMSHALESGFESGHQASIVQINITLFDRVKHKGIVYKRLCGFWRFCVVCNGTVSIKWITARYGGRCWSKLVIFI